MDYIGVFGTFGRKTLAIMLICIGDGIRDSLFNRFSDFFVGGPFEKRESRSLILQGFG